MSQVKFKTTGTIREVQFSAGVNKSCAIHNISKDTYDFYGNIKSETNVVDNNHSITSYYEYDAFGRLTSETDPNGNVTKYAYDGNDNCTSITNAEEIVMVLGRG